MKFIVEFIPIVLLFLYLSFSNYFIELSHSTLGKLLMVSIIVFYARINKYLGLLVCLLIIAFYNASNPILCSLETFEGDAMKAIDSEIASQEKSELEKEKLQIKEKTDEKKMDIEVKREQVLEERNKKLDEENAKQSKFNRAKYIINNKKKMSKKLVRKAEKLFEESLEDDTEKASKEEFTTYSTKYEEESKLLKGKNARKV